jgi:hypothetical protein
LGLSDGREAMREWWAIYGDDLRRIPELVKTGELKAPSFDGFAEAAKAGTLNGRGLVGMWIIDPGTLIASYGLGPPGVGWINERTKHFPTADH